MAQPDLFSAYVGTAQLVNYQADMQASYAKTIALAQAAGDAESLARLEPLGPPPWTDPRAFGILRRVTRKYEAQGCRSPAQGPGSPSAPATTPPPTRPDYTAGEDYSFLSFVGLHGDGMGPRIDLRKLGTRFAGCRSGCCRARSTW
ncbi:hypothetical protein ACRAWD_06900 [Caulobacter segnis]